MRDLDETDLEILELLLADARRPYSDIADVVGLSSPAVSDRVERLQETGVINRFTLDVDRSKLRDEEGIPVFLEIELASTGPDADQVRDRLLDQSAVEHVFVTAQADVLAFGHAPDTDVAGWIEETVDAETVDAFDVTLVDDAEWSPDIGGTEFALSCAECGNTVDTEGTAARFDGELYQFCCSSCADRFADEYQRLQQSAE